MKTYCELCPKHCEIGKELCSKEEQTKQYQRLVDVLKGKGWKSTKEENNEN